MKAITFKSNSDKKIDLLVRVAREMGIETYTMRELTDEEMAMPGYKPSKDQLEEWLAKDDGEKYGIDEAFKTVTKKLKSPKEEENIMQVVIRKRALNAILKTALFVESRNTPGSGDRWAERLKAKIISLANSKVKFAFCKHPSLAKFDYRCYTYKDWIIAFRISESEFEICRFIYGARLS